MSQQAQEKAAKWWGETPAWAAAAHSPTAGARQILVDACGTAGTLDVEGEPLSDALLFRRARIRTHPDRHFGDRTYWDAVEEAGRALGLLPQP